MSGPFSIVDAHVHFWNPQRLDYPWLADVPALNRAFSPADFAAATRAANVGKMIFVESGGESSQSLNEADWVSRLAKSEPRLRGIVANAALEKGGLVRAELTGLARRPLVKGVRRLLQGERAAYFCLRPEFVAGVRLLAEFGFTFDVCIRPEQLRAVTELVRQVPEVQFLLDHLGKPAVRGRRLEPWATELQSLAALPNVSCKISGLTTEADLENWRPENLKPYFETALAAFGFDRVLFGGDWPVCTLATDYPRWVETVLQLTASAGVAGHKKLFQTNAEKMYRV
jgi:L-fuconolactonase